jgi:large subunit ribosomal protein L25
VFVWAEDGMDLKVDVPVVFKGEDACPGLKKGNFIFILNLLMKYEMYERYR